MTRTKRKGLRLLPEEQAQLEWLTAQGYGVTESEAARRAIREAYQRRRQMKTIDFDPTALPAWARRHVEVIALCARDLSFRKNVFEAESTDYRSFLTRTAKKRDISQEEYERYIDYVL